MSDICQRNETDVEHSDKLHEWDVAVGGGPVLPVPPLQIEWVGHLVFTMCEAHAATMTSIPPLPMVDGVCTCRICTT